MLFCVASYFPVYSFFFKLKLDEFSSNRDYQKIFDKGIYEKKNASGGDSAKRKMKILIFATDFYAK